MRSWTSIVAVLVCMSVPLGSCSGSRGPTESSAETFTVEVLKHGIDPQIIPDRFAADFDGDGKIDRVTLTDSAVQIDLTGGGQFHHAVREAGQESPKLWDAAVVSLRRDGKFPSLVLATEQSEPEEPVVQQLVYNDAGRLVHKRLGDYPCDLHDRASRRDFERGMRVCYRVGKTGRGRRAIDIVVFS